MEKRKVVPFVATVDISETSTGKTRLAGVVAFQPIRREVPQRSESATLRGRQTQLEDVLTGASVQGRVVDSIKDTKIEQKKGVSRFIGRSWRQALFAGEGEDVAYDSASFHLDIGELYAQVHGLTRREVRDALLLPFIEPIERGNVRKVRVEGIIDDVMGRLNQVDIDLKAKKETRSIVE